jgi:type I restriction enzyme S subunit
MESKHSPIRQLPSGWEVKKLKDVFSINELSLPANTSVDYQFNYIPIEQVSTNHIDFDNCNSFRFDEAPGRARRILRDNDILISGVRPNLKSFAIFRKPNENNWICSTGFFVLTAKNKEDNLISYYELLSEICGSQFYSYVVGSNYPAIGDSDIRNIRLILPTSEKEKTAIANILSKVDEAIASVQNSIASAERLKKSLMQNLLTGKMKPDGTIRTPEEFYIDEKFGKIPIGWEVKKIKECFKFRNGKGNTTPNLRYYPDDTYCIPVYGGNGITGYYHTALLYKPTILVGRVGEYCGNVFQTPDKSWVTDNAMLVSEVLMQEYDIDFFTLLLNSLNFKQLSDSTGQPKITQGSIGNIHFAYPPTLVEQKEIMYKINDLSNTIIQKQHKNDILVHLKKSLMQNLLTGRVKINEHSK